MREVEDSRKRVDTIMAKGAAQKDGGFLGIGRLRQARAELRAISREYDALKRGMDAQVAAGQKIAEQDRQRLQHLEAQKRLLGSEMARGGWGRAAGYAGRGATMTGGAASFAMGNPAPMVNAISQIPIVGSGLGMIAASALQQIMLGKPILMANLMASAQSRALTGASGRELGAAGNLGLSMGYSRAESLGMYGRYARSAGSTSGFRESLQMRRGYGVDTGDLVGSARQMSLETSRSIQLALVRGIESGAFNRALAQEFAGASSSLMAQLAGAGGHGSARNMTALVAMLSQRLGGIYGRSPGRTAGILGGVQNALLGFAKGQGGDAKNAFMYEALKAANPNKDYIDLLMQADKGVSDPRNFSAIVQGIRRRYSGNRKMQALAFSRMTGRSVTEGYDVMGMKDISPEAMKQYLADGDAAKVLKRRSQEGQRGLGLVKREHALNEKRAAAAAKADPIMAEYNKLQLKAVGLLGQVVEKLAALLGKKPAVTKTERKEIQRLTDLSKENSNIGMFGGIGEFAKNLNRKSSPSDPAPKK